MLWRIYQLGIFFAVIASDIEFGWGNGGSKMAVGVVAAFAAFVATALPIAIYDLARRGKALLLLSRDHRIDHRGLSRR
jgi:hypothetical protein